MTYLKAARTVAVLAMLGIGGGAMFELNTSNAPTAQATPVANSVHDPDPMPTVPKPTTTTSTTMQTASRSYNRFAGTMAVDWARWTRLHNCEQPGNWYANGGNSADAAHQTFQGGLGMSTVAWQMGVSAAARRGVTLPKSALAATPQEQMTGAQAFYDAHGWGWACHV